MTDGARFGEVYYIIWFLSGAKSVGEVRNYTHDLKRYRRIGISLDDGLLRRMHTRFLATEWTNLGPKIRVSTAFMAIPRSLREAGIWHEVGHVHHGHHFRNEARSHRDSGASTTLAAVGESGLVMEEEADRFAVVQSSKEVLIGFLEYLLRDRPSGGRGGRSEFDRRELEARIGAIRAY